MNSVADPRRRIRSTLSALLRQDDDEAYAIFDIRGRDRFVQFSGGLHEPLVLDLPRPSLSDDEWERCHGLVMAMGGNVERSGVETLVIDCGRDAERAADAAMRVLTEGLGFTNDDQLDVETTA